MAELRQTVRSHFDMLGTNGAKANPVHRECRRTTRAQAILPLYFMAMSQLL